MYNERIKQKYIDGIVDDVLRKGVIRDFKTSEPLENRFREDLFCIPSEEIAKQFAKECKSFTTFKNKMSRINRYKEWANNNGIIPENYRGFVYEHCNLMQIYSEHSISVIFHTPMELIQMLNECFPMRHEDGVTLDELTSAYLMLLYQGLRENEVVNIKTADITIKKQSIVISTPDKDILVYDEFQELIRKIYYNRHYINLSIGKHDTVMMSDRFIDNGRGLESKKLIVSLNKNVSRKTMHLKYKISDIYLMGMIFKKKMTTGDSFKREDVLHECYGENFTETNRIKLYDIIRRW